MTDIMLIIAFRWRPPPLSLLPGGHLGTELHCDPAMRAVPRTAAPWSAAFAAALPTALPASQCPVSSTMSGCQAPTSMRCTAWAASSTSSGSSTSCASACSSCASWSRACQGAHVQVRRPHQVHTPGLPAASLPSQRETSCRSRPLRSSAVGHGLAPAAAAARPPGP